MPDSTNKPNENQPRRTDTTGDAQKVTQSQLWDIEVIFDNHTTEPVVFGNAGVKGADIARKVGKYQMSPEIILEMVIEEDILDWPYKGYIVYKNMYEGIERNTDPNAWFFRMDGRDEIRISVKPISEDSDHNPFAESNNEADKIWKMKMDFIVYDVEDLPSSNSATKAKKIYFRDKKYQLMADNKIQWSTATAKSTRDHNNDPIKPSQATDKDRVMYTGDAIQSLLTDLGFEDNFDLDNWDKGSTQLFYTSPTTYSVADDLSKLLSSHASSEHDDATIFKIDRGTGKWQLKPLYKFFDEAGFNPAKPGPLQIEHLFFEDPYPDDNKDTTPYKAPVNKTPSLTNDIKMTNWNTIETYQFVDMSGIDNSTAITSKPVYWYDPSCKQFGVDFKANEITKVRADFKKLYTDKLLPHEKASPIFTLNNTKTNQYNVNPEFGYGVAGDAFDKHNRLLLGRGKILFSGVFLNECISYRLIGSTHRIAGTFVGIDRKTNIKTNRFDDKICGQWFTVNVKHIWKLNKYMNDVTAVKVHSYQDLGINEDVV